MRKGDKVFYCPHMIHGTQADCNGDRPWVYGRRLHNHDVKLPKHVKREVVSRDGEEFEVEVLGGNRLGQYLEFVKRHPNKAEESKNLVPLRPNVLWPAKVKKVNDDGTVDLAILCKPTGAELHYDNVPVTDLKKTDAFHAPHTCHAVPKTDVGDASDVDEEDRSDILSSERADESE